MEADAMVGPITHASVPYGKVTYGKVTYGNVTSGKSVNLLRHDRQPGGAMEPLQPNIGP